MGFLRHKDLFPDAPAATPAEPVSGVHRTAKKRPSKAPAKKPAKKKDDVQRVPVLNVSPRQVRASVEDARARWLAPFIDGVTSLDRVLAASALGPEDALAGMDILVCAGLVTLVPRAADGG